MSNEKFRVKFGLQVGDDAASIDTSGNLTMAGDLTVSGNEIKSSTTNTAITLNDTSVTIAGNLTVQGTTTTVNSETVNIADNIITLNSNVTGTPTESAGIEVERGTDPNSSITWNEISDKWEQNRGGTTTVIPVNTTELNEGTNLYYTDARARGAISVTDTGGDGSLAYDNGTGVITYTGPSATEVRAHFTGGTGVTITDGEIAIGQAVATTSDVTFDDITATGTIKNAGKGIYAGSNKTFSTGDTTDVFRFRSPTGTDDYTAITGLLASNADKTTTLGARPGVAIRGYGQNITGGTTTTVANPGIHCETTRGTPSNPIATGSNEALGILNGYAQAGTTAGSPYWVSENYPVPQTQFVMATVQAQSATPSASATFTANFTTGTTMTVTAVSSGTITPGHEMRYNSGGSTSFRSTNTYAIANQITSDQPAVATTTATTNQFPTTKIIVADATGIAVGQLITGTGIPAGTYVSSISGTTITLRTANNSPALTTANLTGSTVNFYTAGGTGTYTINASPYTSSQTGVSASTYAVTLGTVVLTRSQPSSTALTAQSRPTTSQYTGTTSAWTAQSTYTTSHFVWSTWPTTVTGGTNKTLGFFGPQNSGINADRTTFSSYSNPAQNVQISFPELQNDQNLLLNMNMKTRSSTTFPVINFTNQRTLDNVNYTATQVGDSLGAFKFNGNAYTGTSSGVPAGPAAQISCIATEDWSGTANGAKFTFTTIKQGTTDDLTVIEGSSNQSYFRTDALTFQDSNYQSLKGNAITYSRSILSVHNHSTIAPAAVDTEYTITFDETPHESNNITVVSNSQITFATSGAHRMRFSGQAVNTGSSAAHTYVWLKKNGTDLADTARKVTLLKSSSGDSQQLVDLEWIINPANGDYYTLHFASDSTNVSLEATAAGVPSGFTNTSIPAVPSATLIVMPIGA